MRKMMYAALALGFLAAAPAKAEDVDWNFSKRVNKLEAEVTALKQQVAALQGVRNSGTVSPAPVATGKYVRTCNADGCTMVWVPDAAAGAAVTGSPCPTGGCGNNCQCVQLSAGNPFAQSASWYAAPAAVQYEVVTARRKGPIRRLFGG